MSRPTVLEFTVPESHHHTLELIGQVYAADQATTRAKQREAQQADQIARTKLSKAAERLLIETSKDKLPDGKIPEGTQIKVDFDKRTVSLQVPTPEQQPTVPVVKKGGKAKGKAKDEASS